jgi:hypothetical protein
VSRFESDVDFQNWQSGDDVPFNASCTDCGIDYSKLEGDPGSWCDGCSDRRDEWTSAQEIRVMAKAVLSADLSKIKDVA